MEAEVIYEIENLIGVIGAREKRKNHELNRKVAFLKKYLGVWREDHEFDQIKNNNPFPFFIKEEKCNA